MSEDTRTNAERIRRIALELARIKPVYADTVAFYGELFAAQEEEIGRIALPETAGAFNVVTTDGAGSSAISPADFPVEYDAAGRVLGRVCRITVEHAKGDAPASARILLDALEQGRIDVRMLGAQFLAGETSYGRKLAAELELTAEFLAFATYHALRPSLVAFAKRVAAQRADASQSNTGVCPICGNLPALAKLGKRGEKVLSCSFCWHEWQAPRLFCPFCGNLDGETLGYFAIAQEEEYRIDICDQCKQYIKTVDSGKTERAIYAPLEFMLTMHLDMKAHDKGYTNEISE